MRVRILLAGYRGEEEPRAFKLGERRSAVLEILDRWLAPDHRYFKVKVDDGRTFVLRHDTQSGDWELAAWVGADRHEDCGPSITRSQCWRVI